VRQRLLIQKMRGSAVHGGYYNSNNSTLRTGGLEIFLRFSVDTPRDHAGIAPIPSGLTGLDALMSGRLEAGRGSGPFGPNRGKAIAGAHSPPTR